MATPRKILILSSWYPTPDRPFLGNFVQQQAEVLSKRYEVTVLHTIARSDLKSIEIEEKVNGSLREIIVFFPQGNNFFTRKSSRIQAFKKGFEQIEKPDIIHGHVILPNVYLFKIAKDFFKVPLLITEHSSNFRIEKRKSITIVDRFLLRMAKQSADKIIAVSNFLKKDLTSYFSEDKIEVIGNPVNTKLFSSTHRRQNDFNYFLHVSTLDKVTKNVEGILEAVQLLVQKGYEEVRLKIISDEPMDELREKIMQLGLNRYILLDGPLDHTALVPHFQKASAFVLFSNYESFSIVVAEALSCGIPVIATPVGIAENLPDNVGYQVKIGDPLSLAMAMEKILNDNEFSADIIRKYAEQFSEEVFLEKVEKIYSDLSN